MRSKMSLWYVTYPMIAILLSACGRTEPDRSTVVQLPLFFLVIGAPLISLIFGHRGIPTLLLIFLGQIVVYGIYESGVSVRSDIRVDLLLVAPAFFINLIVIGIIKWRQSRK
jgi:hypothetical protein